MSEVSRLKSKVSNLKAKVSNLRTEKQYLKDMVVDIIKPMDKTSRPYQRLSRLVKFGSVSAICSRCGRPLKSQRSIATGMGPGCLKKSINEKQVPLELKVA